MVPAPAPDTPEAVDAVVATAAAEPMAAVPPATRAGWLPAALRDDNPWRVPRRVDGVAA